MVIEEHVVNKIVESVKQRLGDESRNYRDSSLAIAFDPLIQQATCRGILERLREWA